MNTLIYHQSRNVLQGSTVTLSFQELPLDFLNNVILGLCVTYTFKRTYGTPISFQTGVYTCTLNSVPICKTHFKAITPYKRDDAIDEYIRLRD